MLANRSAIRYSDAVTTTTGLRARVRAELLEEIKRLAREQIAREGAGNLSLRAVSRELGMASSAIYRYYASRDQLLTALIIDSYEALGAAVEEADATVARADLHGRWRAIATALRQWALDQPAEYALIFGTPVPGYAAPTDTIGPAQRYSAVLVALLVDINTSQARPGAARRRTSPPHAAVVVSPELTAQYDILRERMGAEIPDGLLLLGLAAWMNLFGAVSLELFGHLHNVIDEPAVHYAALVDQLGARIVGDRPPAGRRPTAR